jgi:hypothetical protein
MCHDFVGLREFTAVPDALGEQFYPHGHIQVKNLKFFGLFAAHRRCLGCTLCGTPFWNKDAVPAEGFIIRKVSDQEGTLKINTYCAASPGSTCSCSEVYEAHEAGLKRLQDIETLPSLTFEPF